MTTEIRATDSASGWSK